MEKLSPLEELKVKLQKKKCKMTTQRQVILQIFVDFPEKHLSAEDVFQILRENNSEIGLATVYRTLELLSEIEILQKMDFGDGRSRYELDLTDISAHHHHHLICKKCGHVLEFADDLLDELEKNIQDKCQFKILDHEVKFYGYCRECQQNSED